jgi:hypothetical protein
MTLTSSMVMPIRGSVGGVGDLPAAAIAAGDAFGFACFASLCADPAFSLGAFVATEPIESMPHGKF